jgi:hypothetical protein
MTAPTTLCPACAAPVSGNFCSGCGASLAARSCPACQARLSPRARFCHRCGNAAPLSPPALPPHPEGRERTAWLVAGGLCVLLLGTIIYKVTGGISAAATPDMANPGAGGAAPSRPAPDISRMTPRERFDRLFNRIMQAAEQGDAAQIERFLPMALGAYSQLDSPDADARYHAAVLHLRGGDLPGALALADTILAAVPTHLLGYMVRAEAAALAGDKATGTQAMRDFVAHYEAEMKANRPEYSDHRPAIEEFRESAVAITQS